MQTEFRKQSLVVENTFESNIHTPFNLALAEVYGKCWVIVKGQVELLR